VERNLTNKVKLASQSKSQPSTLQTSSLKPGNKDADLTKQLKARVANLEKSYEVLKSKHRESETEKTRLIEENAKQAEEIAKMKAARTRLNKEVHDLKASQASHVETARKAMVVDELEKCQTTAASSTP